MAKLLVLAANLLPLAGVWLWGWDAFQVLMLYWAETVIVAFWTLARIATYPDPEKTAAGRILTNLGHTAFFTLHAGIFISVHLMFLMVIFAGPWKGGFARPVAFVDRLFIQSGAWPALVFAFVAGLIGFVTATPTPTIAAPLLRRLGYAPSMPAHGSSGTAPISPIIKGLYTRIAVMQVGIIFGAWFAQSLGSRAPLIIVIVLKSLIELRGWLPWKITADGKIVSGGSASR
jgi:hypothetical protein